MYSNTNGIYKQVYFGKIHVKLKDLMDKQGVNRNQLSALTGIKYDVVTRYCKGEGIERVDLAVLAKFCFVLKCGIDDILEYRL